MAKVRACAVPALDLAAFAGQPAVIGLDIGTTASMTVAAFVFRTLDATTSVVLHGFIPAEGLTERIHRDRVPYDLWIHNGHVETTPGPIVQFEAVRAYIRSVAARVQIQAISYDDWGAVALAQGLEADGFTVVKVEQSPKGLAAACRELERLIAERTLQYASPLFEAHAANAMIRTTDAGMMPGKASETQRIDALSATLTALAHLIATPAPSESVYNTRGILTV
jgi:phage terminase large subunit-like protein